MVDWQKQDIPALSAVLAPDFLFTGPRGFKTRDETLNALGHCSVASFSLDTFKMRRTSVGSAILAYTIHRDMTCGGHKVLGETINTDAFVKSGNKWQMVFTSEVELPNPSKP